jgi:hypothetical protein
MSDYTNWVFYFVGVTDCEEDGEAIRRGLTGQNHTTVATTRIQNPIHSLRICLLIFTDKLSGLPPEPIKVNEEM